MSCEKAEGWGIHAEAGEGLAKVPDWPSKDLYAPSFSNRTPRGSPDCDDMALMKQHNTGPSTPVRRTSQQPVTKERLAIVEAYLDVREKAAAQAAERMSGERRSAQIPLLKTLSAFFSLYDKAEGARSALDGLYFKSRTRGKTAASFIAIRDQYPEEVSLLGLEAPLTFDRLKAAYRAAALRHHPDRGGETATMQQVVGAYGALHDALSVPLFDGNDTDTLGLQGKSARTAVRSARVRWLSAALDVYDIDEAVTAFESLAASGDLATAWRGHGDTLRHELPLLARLLAATDHSDKARYVLGQYAHHIDSMGTEWRELNRYGFEAPSTLRGHIDAGKAQKRLPISTRHITSAQNLFRSGLITVSAYETRERTAAQTQKRMDRVLDRLRAHSIAPGFLRVQEDGDLAAGPADAVIPHPGYIDDITHLSPDQRAAYARAFSADVTWKAVRAYELVRIRSLTRALLADLDGSIDGQVIEEVGLLAAADKAAQSRAFTRELCAGLAGLVRRLASMSTDQRERTRYTLFAAERSRSPFDSMSPLPYPLVTYGPLSEVWFTSAIELQV